MDIPIGPLRADSAAGVNPGDAAFVSNVGIRRDNDGVFYTPKPSLSVGSSATALNGPFKGGFSARTSSGTVVNFVCTSDTIYTVSSAGVVTSIGTGYNLPTGDMWSMCQFGTKAIFTNKTDGMLAYDIDAGGAVSAISGAPKARVVRAVFDVLFALDCDGNNRLVRNSDFVYTNWTSGVAGYQEFPDGLDLQGIEEINDSTAILFQRGRIRLVTRQPTQALWFQTTMARNEGAINPWCIVPAHGAVYFIDVNGIKRAGSDGVVPIGLGKVDHYFWDTYASASAETVLGAYDPVNDVVRWITKDTATDTNYAHGVEYDIRADEFVFREETLSGIMSAATAGYTLEELDAFGTVDTITESFDSRLWYGGTNGIFGISSAYKVGSYSGAYLAANFVSNTVMLPTRAVFKRMLADTDSANVQAFLAVSERIADGLTTSAISTPDASGHVELEHPAGKNFRLEATIPAGETWTYMRGYRDISLTMNGVR